MLKGTVSPYNSKAVRASAGSVFRVPFVAGLEPAQVLAIFREHRIDLNAAMPGPAARPVADVNLRRPCALVIGSEGQGVSNEMRSAATEVTIPTIAVESLNAAISAAILLYEARRQRTQE